MEPNKKEREMPKQYNNDLCKVLMATVSAGGEENTNKLTTMTNPMKG